MTENNEDVMKSLGRAGPGRPRDMSKHAEILRAAAYLFTEKGFSGTTMDDIAARAGVSKLTVYNHFGTKEMLFHEAIRAKCEAHTGDDLFALLPGTNPEIELFNIATAFINLIFSDDALAMHRVMIADGQNAPDLAMMFYKAGPMRLFDRFGRYLERLEQQHGPKFPDQLRASQMFFGLLKGEPWMRALLQIPPKPSRAELDEFAREAVRFYLRAFGFPASGRQGTQPCTSIT